MTINHAGMSIGFDISKEVSIIIKVLTTCKVLKGTLSTEYICMLC